MDTKRPCPFCGSHTLDATQVCDDDGEYVAIECSYCKAEAPADVWDKRSAMTEDTANETVSLVDDLLDIGVEMTQELQDILDDMREASGDDSDGAHIAALVERWEVSYVRLMGLVEAEDG